MAEITVASGRCWQYSHYVGRRGGAGNGFTQPVGVVAGKDDVIYVLNRASPRVTKATVAQEFLGEFGRGGEEEGQWVWPTDLALDQDENVFTADEWLNRITVFDKDGNVIKTWGEAGEGEGQLNGPSGMAFDADNNVWIVNSLNSRVQKFTTDGQFITAFGTKGNADGELDMPWGITLDNDGNIYVADWNNHRVQKFNTNGDYLMTFGSGKETGVSSSGDTPYIHATVREVDENPNDLNHPTGVAVDQDGDVYVVDWMNERVVIFNSLGGTLATLRGEARGLSKWAEMSIVANPDMGKARRRVKNPEVQNYFRMPVACTFDQATNRLLIADTHRGRVQVFEKDQDYMDPQFNL